jgi:hypothetical protein
MVPARGWTASAELSCVRVERRTSAGAHGRAWLDPAVVRPVSQAQVAQRAGGSERRGQPLPRIPSLNIEPSLDYQPCLLASFPSPPALAYQPVQPLPLHILPAMPASILGNLPALWATAKVKLRPALLSLPSLVLARRLRASTDRLSAELPRHRGAHLGQGRSFHQSSRQDRQSNPGADGRFAVRLPSSACSAARPPTRPPA